MFESSVDVMNHGKSKNINRNISKCTVIAIDVIISTNAYNNFFHMQGHVLVLSKRADIFNIS